MTRSAADARPDSQARSKMTAFVCLEQVRKDQLRMKNIVMLEPRPGLLLNELTCDPAASAPEVQNGVVSRLCDTLENRSTT
jgi:hypothetical protein